MSNTNFTGATCRHCGKHYPGCTMALCSCGVPKNYFRVKHDGQSCVVEKAGDIAALIEGATAGDVYTVVVENMTPAEFNGLPEFAGF